MHVLNQGANAGLAPSSCGMRAPAKQLKRASALHVASQISYKVAMKTYVTVRLGLVASDILEYTDDCCSLKRAANTFRRPGNAWSGS